MSPTDRVPRKEGNFIEQSLLFSYRLTAVFCFSYRVRGKAGQLFGSCSVTEQLGELLHLCRDALATALLWGILQQSRERKQRMKQPTKPERGNSMGSWLGSIFVL